MTIGILGGGQLGYMLALAGYPLGLHFRFFDPSPEAPVGRIAPARHRRFSTMNPALEKFAAGLELVTYEFENVPVDGRPLSRANVFRFSRRPRALEIAQDRIRKKRCSKNSESPRRSSRPSQCRDDLDAAVKKSACPPI